MHVRVDERGREHEARAVDDAVLVRVESLADRRDRAGVNAHVEDGVDPLHRVEHAGAAHDDVLSGTILDVQHHATSAAASARTPTGPPVSTSYRTAMRMTRPERTCVSTSASTESATRGSISTPRFIGPGCMTFWPGRSRSGVTPQRAAYSRRLGTKLAPASMRSCCMRRT